MGEQPAKRPREILPSIKRATAIRYFRKRLEGKTTKQVADEVGMSDDHVHQYLTWGDKAGIFAHIEDQLFSTLLPLAEQTLIEAMQDGDAQVALEIYKGTQVLRDAKVIASGQASKLTDTDPLMAYVNKIRLEEADERGTIEGRIAGEQRQLGDGGGNSHTADREGEVQKAGGDSTEAEAWERLAEVGEKGNGSDSSQGIVAGVFNGHTAGETIGASEVESGTPSDDEKVEK